MPHRVGQYLGQSIPCVQISIEIQRTTLDPAAAAEFAQRTENSPVQNRWPRAKRRKDWLLNSSFFAGLHPFIDMNEPALSANIRRLELDVQTIVPFHGMRTVDMSELARHSR